MTCNIFQVMIVRITQTLVLKALALWVETVPTWPHKKRSPWVGDTIAQTVQQGLQILITNAKVRVNRINKTAVFTLAAVLNIHGPFRTFVQHFITKKLNRQDEEWKRERDWEIGHRMLFWNTLKSGYSIKNQTVNTQ